MIRRFFSNIKFIGYEKNKAKKELNKICKWEDYGGHHHENYLSIFINNYYNIKKFKINRKLITYSAQIRSNLINKSYAKNLIKEESRIESGIIDYCIDKLGFNRNEWDNIMSSKKKYYFNYCKTFIF